MLIEKLDELGKIGERTGQTIDLVDDDDVDLAGADIVQQTLEGRAVGIATGEAAIVIFGPDQGPAGMGLASDIGLRRIILGIEGVEVLLQALTCRRSPRPSLAPVGTGPSSLACVTSHLKTPKVHE